MSDEGEFDSERYVNGQHQALAEKFGARMTMPPVELRQLQDYEDAMGRRNQSTPVPSKDTVTYREASPARDELAGWWKNRADDEIGMVVDKAIEYGSTDLEDIGHRVVQLAGRPPVSDAEAAQIGIYFYVEGKLARWRSAIHRGEVASADTLLDIGVYVRMAQRVQETGGWPGTNEELK